MIRCVTHCRPALLSAAIIATGLANSACHAPVAAPVRTALRIATGTPGAGFHPFGQALAGAYAVAFPTIDVSVQESAGSVANVEALQRGSADLGLAYADVGYMAYVGKLGDQQLPSADLRGIAVLELAAVHLVVRAGSHIIRPSDLRGRRVAVGPTGSGSALTARLVLEAFGIGPADVRVESLKYNDAAVRLAGGTLDAMFVTGSDPVEAVRSATRAGARLVPLVGTAIERLRHDYPFFRLTVIPGGSYSGHPDHIGTLGIESLLVCRRSLDESLVHDLTKRLFEVAPAFSTHSLVDFEQAPATPIPLHQGAARYYRERELSR